MYIIDWAISDTGAFVVSLERAAQVTRQQDALVTVGIVPTRADPGFGYIQPAEQVGEFARRVARFAEKPDRATARRMVDEGYLWNSGIFVWRVGYFLDQLRKHTPEVAPALDQAGGDIDRFFAAVRPVSIDVGVMLSPMTFVHSSMDSFMFR